jgi:penicillin G amidase
MKWFKRIALSLFVVLLLSLLGAYVWLRSSKPLYDGELQVAGLTQAVSVHFDDTGIPHIKAENKADLYRAFGYIHAQDRLFQMEMMRRVGKGNLAEVIGQKGIKIDRVFRTIGMPDYAQQSADELAKTGSPELLAEIDAYLAGINAFISTGATPPEFSLIGIPKTPFTRVDLFYITGAMSFSFSQAQKTEPVIDFISKKWGQDHLRDLALYHDSTETYIPSYPPDSLPFDTSMHRTSLSNANETLTSWSSAMAELEELLPFAPLEGSNSWVVAPERTKNKAVLFCNDTHIGYMLPQTWYEAHLICPNFEMYGHFLSGIPFALVGQNTQISWGLTMLENDDMDFYHEQIEGDKCFYKGQWTALQVRSEKISVKGSEDTTITIRTGPHGPLVDGLFDEMGAAVAISWSYTQVPNENGSCFSRDEQCHLYYLVFRSPSRHTRPRFKHYVWR